MCQVAHALLVGNDIPLISTGSFKNIYITERESRKTLHHRHTYFTNVKHIILVPIT